MSPTELHARREFLELELAQMEQDAAKKSALLAAYKLVESDISGSVISIPAKVAVPTVKEEIQPPLFLRPREGDQPTQLVRRAIADMTTKFTLREIAARLELLGTPLDADRISIVLSRLAKTGELKVFEQGVGRRATQYAPPLTPAMKALLG